VILFDSSLILKKEGKRTGNRVPLPDFLIGAHAQSERLKLVTRTAINMALLAELSRLLPV
jgi:predicted nucleic acid-binding protein